MFQSFTSLGKDLQHYGVPDLEDRHKYLREASNEKRCMMLLCAAVTELTSIRRLTYQLLNKSGRDPTPADQKHPVSDGIHSALRKMVACRDGHVFIPEDTTGLGVRARRTVRKARAAGAMTLEDLSKDFLLNLNGCGYTTAHEILRWKATQRETP